MKKILGKPKRFILKDNLKDIMPFLNTNTARRRQLALEIALKMRLENPFATNLRAYFKQISKDFKVIYSTTGMSVDTSRYNDELRATLKKHYRKISKAFSDNLRTVKDIKIAYESKQNTDNEISAKMAEYIDDHSEEQTEIINKTTQKELNIALIVSIATLSETGKEITSEDIAVETSKTFNAKIPARSDLIAVTETQNIAEETKEIEVLTLAEQNAIIAGTVLSIAILKKRWLSVLDAKTRHSHAVLDNTVIKVTESFMVGGYPMSRPGDSRTAPPQEFMNCRCMLTYGI